MINIRWIVFAVILVVLPWHICCAQSPAGELTMAIFPCTDAANSFKKFHPLVTYLQQVTRLKISLVFHDDLAGYKRALKNGSLDFVIQDPYVYIKLADMYGSEPVLKALTVDRETSMSGVVVVRKGSGLTHIADLKGKTVMFGPALSSPRWIAARHLFKKNGFQIDRDLMDYSNRGCCEDVAFNVFLNVVDAGVVCDHFLQEQAGRHPDLGLDVGQLVVIAATERVPTKIFSVRKNARGEDVESVARALIHLDIQDPGHRHILENADLGGFQKASVQDLNQIRQSLTEMLQN